MDPAELRRKNYLSAADLPYELDIPYRDGNRLVYDSGDFRANLDAALDAIDYDLLRARAGGRAQRARHLPRHRHLRLCRGHRHRPLRGRDGADGRVGPRGGGHRRLQPGAGTRDLVRPGGGGRPRRPAGLGHRGGRRHRRHPVRHRHLRQPERRQRGLAPSTWPQARCATSSPRPPPRCWRRRRRRRDRGRRGARCGARPASGAARARGPGLAAHLRQARRRLGGLRGHGVSPPAHRHLYERGARGARGGGRGHRRGAAARATWWRTTAAGSSTP